MAHPTPTPAPNRHAAQELLRDFSLEMTGKDVPGLEEAKHAIPLGTKINVTFLGNEDLEMRVAAAKRVKDLGFVPVPHISARRLDLAGPARGVPRPAAGGRRDGARLLGRRRPDRPRRARTPPRFDVIRSGILPKYGVREVSIAGYPEGHPDISTPTSCGRHLEEKSAALKEQGLDAVILTQFAFDTDPVLAWIEDGPRARDRHADPRRHPRTRRHQAPARLRAPVRHRRQRDDREEVRLLADQPDGHRRSGPVRRRDLVEPCSPTAPSRRRRVKLHFYTFGGLLATSDWAREFSAAQS